MARPNSALTGDDANTQVVSAAYDFTKRTNLYAYVAYADNFSFRRDVTDTAVSHGYPASLLSATRGGGLVSGRRQPRGLAQPLQPAAISADQGRATFRRRRPCLPAAENRAPGV